jgi:hypothetical protein
MGRLPQLAGSVPQSSELELTDIWLSCSQGRTLLQTNGGFHVEPAAPRALALQIGLDHRHAGLLCAGWLATPSSITAVNCLLGTELLFSSRGKMTLGVEVIFLVYFSHSTTMACPPKS